VITNEPFGIGRAIALFSLPLDTMRAIGKAHGGTLNDVVLAIVDDALMRYFAQRGELPDKRLVAACPVATREPGDTRAGTDATMIFIPLGAPDLAPHERLRVIIDNARAAKAEVHALSKQAAKDYALLALGIREGIGAVGLGARVAPLANLAVSNVPGPRVPLYLGRAKLESIFPISMLASGVGLNVTLVSTADHMHFGVVAGASLMPDVRKLEALCKASLAALA
jgi:diacylglycerol O-acyltransferase